MRECPTCKEYKNKSEYYPKDFCTLGKSCKECRQKYAQKYYLKNKEKIKFRAETWRKENKERWNELGRKWRKDNPLKSSESMRKSYEKNITKHTIKSLCKRAHKKQATPSWSNHFFISEIYKLAILRTKITGIKWHVDHVVPIKSKLVCGLHVEDNLMVIPAVQNLKKRNLFEII
jgi:hypothetical protein